jgi:hypothetical protein
VSTPGFAQPSIAEIPEDKLVERLLSELWGSEYFELASIPKGMVNRQRVLLDTAPGKFRGDIDALLCAPDRPDQAVAYQVKRIKFGIDQLRNQKPTKLREYKKVAQQANLLARMGFWQVYVYVVVVVDAREQNAGKNTYAGLSSELESLVSSAISTQPLNDRVGLATLDFTQPMDYAPFTVGSSGFHLHRLSEPAKQSEELTRWVAGIFANFEWSTS